MVTPMVLYFRSLTVAVPRGFIYKYMPRNWSGSICIGDNSTGRGIYPVGCLSYTGNESTSVEAAGPLVEEDTAAAVDHAARDRVF